MKRLWCRRLRIPIYCILVLLVIQVFRYLFTSESSEVSEKNALFFDSRTKQFRDESLMLSGKYTDIDNDKRKAQNDPDPMSYRKEDFIDVVEFDGSDQDKSISKNLHEKDADDRDDGLFDEVEKDDSIERQLPPPSLNKVVAVSQKVLPKDGFVSSTSTHAKKGLVEKNKATNTDAKLKATESTHKMAGTFVVSGKLTVDNHANEPLVKGKKQVIDIHDIVLPSSAAVNEYNKTNNDTSMDVKGRNKALYSVQQITKDKQLEPSLANKPSINYLNIQQFKDINDNKSLVAPAVLGIHGNVANVIKSTKNRTNTDQVVNSEVLDSNSSSHKKHSLVNMSYIYKPDWELIDARPSLSWYDNAKFGIFIHWGVYSVPSFASEKIWWKWKGPQKDQEVIKYMSKFFPNSSYEDLATRFTAKYFNASKWADLFQESGAQYVVLTSKHHDGYAMWPSKFSKKWNSMDLGPHEDLVGMLEHAIRTRSKLKFGLYYSLFEWFNKLYLKDKANEFNTTEYVDRKVIPELMYLINQYKPDILWADGDLALSSYWKSSYFLGWLYNKSEVKDTIVTNDRWGTDVHCKHGDFVLCPPASSDTSQLKKWEMDASIDRLSWGYRHNASLKELMTTKDILALLVKTVSQGGNLLLNIGPTKDGTIPSVIQEKLLYTGKWLSINGEGIYSSRPWRVHNDSFTPDIWYTFKNNTIYAFLLVLPKDDVVFLKSPISSSSSKISLLGWNKPLTFLRGSSGGVKVTLPNQCQTSGVCQSVTTLKLENFK